MFTRAIKKLSKITSRYFSKPATKYTKNTKILQYFEETHGYSVTTYVTNLRNDITNVLNKGLTSEADIKLCARVPSLDVDCVLCLLNTWGTTHPHTLPSSLFYHSFFKIVQKGVWRLAEWNQLVQIIHFVGCSNSENDAKSLMISLLHSASDSVNLQNAPFKDICIICEAAFRLSTLVTTPQLRGAITRVFQTNGRDMTSDSVWLVMIIKMMTLSNYFPVDLLEGMADGWLKSGQLRTMPFTTQVYILALFAQASLRNDKIFQVVVSSAEQRFHQNTCSLRLKDVSMFLWSLSCLGYQLNDRFLKAGVLPFLSSQLGPRNMTEGLNMLIQSCTSMWMMGFTPISLMRAILTMDSFQVLKGKKNRRELSRFAVLLDIMELYNTTPLAAEQRQVQSALGCTQVLTPNIEREVQKRPLLDYVCQSMRNAGLLDVQLEYPVKFYIAGVSGTLDGRPVHVDLLDHATCLLNTTQPVGLVQAKVKLLRRKNPHVTHAFVSESIVQLLNSSDAWREALGLPSLM